MVFSILAILSFSVFAAYTVKIANRLKELKSRYFVRFGTIEKLFYRRYELIQNTANTVRAYLIDEAPINKLLETKELAYEMVQQAAQNPNIATIDQVVAVERILDRDLHNLFSIIDQVDHLKHNQSIRWLQDEIALTTQNIDLAKQPFNDAVVEYNHYKQRFPSTFLAPNIGHTLNAAALT